MLDFSTVEDSKHSRLLLLLFTLSWGFQNGDMLWIHQVHKIKP